MGRTMLEQELETCRKKISVLEEAFSANVSVYQNINVTKNLIPGSIHQIIDGVDYNVSETLGFPENCRYEDIVKYWSKRIEPDEQDDFVRFFSVDHLMQCYERGEDHIVHNYHTKGQAEESMSIEQHVVMYPDLTNRDLMAITYVRDNIRIAELQSRDMEQRRRLQDSIRRIEGLASQYGALYYVSFDKGSVDRFSSRSKDGAETTGTTHMTLEEFFEMFRENNRVHTHPDYRSDISRLADENFIRDKLKNTKRYSCRFLHMDTEGDYKWSEIILINILEKEGKLKEVAYAFLNVDGAEREKEAQKQALMDALAAAEHANRAKTAFLNNMSHDIRTPMNAIIGYTALAAAHIDNREMVKDYLSKISTSSNHLLSLINDVLDMSRIESGRVKIEEKEVHLPDVLHDLRTIIQSGIASKQQDLYIDTQDIVNEDIITDKLRLNQILLNIVSNAIKFTPSGGTISIRIIQKPCNLKDYATYEFRVKDNGIGMSEEFRHHIFETFSREHSTTISGIQGTGLGMSITKNIVDMMGGTIEVNSEEGRGTEFVVVLDCRISENTVKYEAVPELQGARALVVDDDTNTCISVSKMLKQIGMRADWTVSGKESIVRAREAYEEGDEFKAFIIDWLMPDMNGIETVRRIRKVIGNATPIIILTAYDWSDIEMEAREAGVTAFVSKPLFMSELREVLTRPVRVKNEDAEEKADFTGKRILLAEDNEFNREIASEILKAAGFDVDFADDGSVAVEKINSSAAGYYDLILMDIQMPKMNGYIATREIRTLDDNKKANIPIIAMTANAFEEDREKAVAAGMDGFISKPIDINKLIRTLAKNLK